MKNILGALVVLITFSAPVPALPADLSIFIEVPQINASEYHRPYVAVWIEKPDGKVLASLAVWYDTGMPNAGGEEWLKDLRQWWRKEGRASKENTHAVSSPTKPVGTHEVSKKGIELPPLEDGEYTLMIEAAREVGGREVVRIPFRWDGRSQVSATANGSQEIGTVQFSATISQ